MKRSLKLILPVIAILINSTSSQANIAFPAKPVTKAKLGANEEYVFQKIYDINHGISQREYKFGKEGNTKSIYSGVSFGESDNCPPPEMKNKINMPIAVLRNSFSKKDYNIDGIDDINLSIAEQDCTTGKIVFKEILILSKDNEFVIQRLQNKN